MTQKQFHEIICLSQSQDSTCVQNDINNNKCLNKKRMPICTATGIKYISDNQIIKQYNRNQVDNIKVASFGVTRFADPLFYCL